MHKKYKTLNEFEEELHPWKPFIPAGAHQIILGTFPTTEKFRGSYEFFYPNPNNDFWRLIFGIADKNLDDYENDDPIKIRNAVLSQLSMGIADIGYRVFRQKGSSKDENLFPLEYTDIFALLDDHPGIKKIICTSSSGSSSVVAWFHHYCELNNHSFIIPKGKLPKQSKLLFKSRNIKIEIISSTSRLSPIKGDSLLSMYKAAILSN